MSAALKFSFNALPADFWTLWVKRTIALGAKPLSMSAEEGCWSLLANTPIGLVSEQVRGDTPHSVGRFSTLSAWEGRIPRRFNRHVACFDFQPGLCSCFSCPSTLRRLRSGGPGK